MKFIEGQEVTLFVKGAGVVTEEKTTIERIADGVIFTADRKFGMDGKWLEKDNMFGFDFWIKP